MIKTKLREFQIEALNFMVNRKNSIISMKTGLGKTLSVLSYIDFLFEFNKIFYAVVFAPKQAVNLVWTRQIEEHTDFEYVLIDDLVENNKLDLNRKIILISYSRVEKFYYLILNLVKDQLVVFDEIHKLKSTRTKRYDLFITFRDKPAYKVGLTATPLLNSPVDLYGIVSIIDKNIFKSYSYFVDRYCKIRELKLKDRVVNEIVGIKNRDELVSVLNDLVYVKFLDIKINFISYSYELSEDEELRYLIASEGALNETSIKGFAQRLHDLQRVVDGSIDLGGSNLTSNIPSKYLPIRELLKSILSKNESAIIYTEYHFSLNLLKNTIKSEFNCPVYEISGLNIDKIEYYPNVIVMTMAGSESLNLSKYNHVIFYSIPFSVGTFIQLVGRITRLDSKYLNNLNVYIPDNPYTIDKYKYVMIMSNKSIIEDVFGKEPNLSIVDKKIYRKEFLFQYRKTLLWWFRSKKHILNGLKKESK